MKLTILTIIKSMYHYMGTGVKRTIKRISCPLGDYNLVWGIDKQYKTHKNTEGYHYFIFFKS